MDNATAVLTHSRLSDTAKQQIADLHDVGCRVYARADEAGTAYVSVEYRAGGRRYFRKHTSSVSREAAVNNAYRHFVEAVKTGDVQLVAGTVDVPSATRALKRMGVG